MVVIFQVEVFWVVTLCSVVVRYQRFGVPCCFHLQGEHFTASQSRRPGTGSFESFIVLCSAGSGDFWRCTELEFV